MRRAPSGYPLCTWDDRCPYLGTHRGMCGHHDTARRHGGQPGQQTLDLEGVTHDVA